MRSRYIQRILIIAFLVAGWLPACFIRAEEPAAPTVKEREREYPWQAEEEWVDQVHRSASSTFVATSRWIDGFLSDSRIVEEENGSRARLKLSAIYDENDGFDFKPRLNIRVHLPRVSEQLRLLLFASEDEKPELEAERAGDGLTAESDRQEASAALQYFLKETDKYNISFSGGVSFEYLYGGVRYRYVKDIGHWGGRFVTKMRYYTDDGWQNLNTLDLDRELSAAWFLRATAQLDWLEEGNDLPLALMLRLYWLPAPAAVLSWEWENHFASVKRDELTDLWLLIRCRQRLNRDWLFVEFSPRVNFPKDRDREANWSFLFRIEMNFGFAEN